MWKQIAHFILTYRTVFIIGTVILTAFMVFQARKAELTYDYIAIVPSDDEELIYFKKFKEIFGEDSNVLAIGLQDSSVYQMSNFLKFKQLSDTIAKLPGVSSIFSLPRLQYITKDSSDKLYFTPLFQKNPASQAELDSLLRFSQTLRFYESQVTNSQNGATLLLVTIEKSVLNSPKRQILTNKILALTQKFEAESRVNMRFAGVPFIRSVMATKVQSELRLFLALSVLVTALTLLLFFRAWDAMFFPLLVIGVVVIWTLGTIGLLGYKITLLTGLIPSIIVVMSIPTCIYLLNKYHQEFVKHQDKEKALIQTISKLGLASFLINATTAVGFIVWVTNRVDILTEFGIVAGLNVFVAFFISLFLIPAFFSYLPNPSQRKLKYLDSKGMASILNWLDKFVKHYSAAIYIVTAVLTAASIYGISKISSETYMMEDLPEDNGVKEDLVFFEKNFKGVMPLEIVIDTGEKQGVTKLKNLQKIDEFEQMLMKNPALSKPISMIAFVKTVRQAYYNGNPEFYDLPSNQDRPQIMLALRKFARENQETGGGGAGGKLVRSFIDTSGRQMRISLKVADLGSFRLDTLVKNSIEPAIQTAFKDSPIKAKVTGTTLLFTKGNEYLNNSLLSSLISSLIVIAVLTAFLFSSVRIIIICLIPNIIALVLTGGLMGLLDIPLKPATALIFSISFGIIVDVSTHYLARYRQEIKFNKLQVAEAIRVTTLETGASIIYSSIILFFGFVIFVWSDFGGTKALGVLMSASMVLAMITNLTLLPALLLTFDTKRNEDKLTMLVDEEEFYTEFEDEEIDTNLLQVKQEDEITPVLPPLKNNE